MIVVPDEIGHWDERYGRLWLSVDRKIDSNLTYLRTDKCIGFVDDVNDDMFMARYFDRLARKVSMFMKLSDIVVGIENLFLFETKTNHPKFRICCIRSKDGLRTLEKKKKTRDEVSSNFVLMSREKLMESTTNRRGDQQHSSTLITLAPSILPP